MNEWLSKLGESAARNSPAILTTLAVFGVGSTTLLAIKATGPALKAIDQLEADHANFYNTDDDLPTKMEYLKVAAPYYLPTIVSGLITAACIVASNRINIGRYGTLATLYGASERALTTYQEKVIETFGARKAEKIADEIAQDRLLNDPVQHAQVYITGKGDHLCYDSWSGRYFKGDIEKIKRAENQFNADILQQEGFKTLNELYADIGLDPVEGGQQIGWGIDIGLLSIRFTAKLTTENEPCIVLEFPVNPRYI